MAVTIMPDEALLRAEIDRNVRRRMVGAYLALGAALLFFAGAVYSLRMMHGADAIPADGIIVGVGPDPQTGESMMTVEFTDRHGVLNRDVEPSTYHYSRGEPKVGERIGDVYKEHYPDKGLWSAPRADRILQWAFGVAATLMGALGCFATVFVVRQRNLRRRLLRSGRREPASAHAIENKTVVVPGGSNQSMTIQNWRLLARYFEPSVSEFRDCHSDWQPFPTPQLLADSAVPPVFVDRDHPKRYWMPLGGLAKPS